MNYLRKIAQKISERASKYASHLSDRLSSLETKLTAALTRTILENIGPINFPLAEALLPVPVKSAAEQELQYQETKSQYRARKNDFNYLLAAAILPMPAIVANAMPAACETTPPATTKPIQPASYINSHSYIAITPSSQSAESTNQSAESKTESRIEQLCKQYNSDVPKKLFKIYSSISSKRGHGSIAAQKDAREEAAINTEYALQYLDGMNDEIAGEIRTDNRLDFWQKKLEFLLGFVAAMPQSQSKWIYRFEHMSHYITSTKNEEEYVERLKLREIAIQQGKCIESQELEKVVSEKSIIIIGTSKKGYGHAALQISALVTNPTFIFGTEYKIDEDMIKKYLMGDKSADVKDLCRRYPEIMEKVGFLEKTKEIEISHVFFAENYQEFVFYDPDDMYPYDLAIIKKVTALPFSKTKIIVMPALHTRPIKNLLIRRGICPEKIGTVITLRPPEADPPKLPLPEKPCGYDLYILPEINDSLLQLPK